MDLEGLIDNLPISISIMQNESMEKDQYPVRITLSEDPKNFADDNRYFDGYPNLVELYKLSKEVGIHHTENSYTESYTENTKTYRIVFLTFANEEDFSKFYTESYENKNNFKSEEDEYQKFFSWSDGDYDHKVVFQKSNNLVAVEVQAPLP